MLLLILLLQSHMLSLNDYESLWMTVNFWQRRNCRKGELSSMEWSVWVSLLSLLESLHVVNKRFVTRFWRRKIYLRVGYR